MKCSYTNFETIGIMTFEEADKYIEEHEMWSKEVNPDIEYEFKIQNAYTTKKGLLVKEEHFYIYHFINLNSDNR